MPTTLLKCNTLFLINTRVFGYVVVQLFMWYVYNYAETAVAFAHASKIIHW